MIRLKDDNGVLQITDINWTHLMLKQHRKWSKEDETGTIEAKKVASMAPALFRPPTFEDVFAPSKKLVPIFTSIDAPVTGRESYYSASQTREVLDQYIRKYDLVVSKKKSHINPNEVLAEALYKVYLIYFRVATSSAFQYDIQYIYRVIYLGSSEKRRLSLSSV